MSQYGRQYLSFPIIKYQGKVDHRKKIYDKCKNVISILFIMRTNLSVNNLQDKILSYQYRLGTNRISDIGNIKSMMRPIY